MSVGGAIVISTLSESLWSANKDLLALAISIFALAVSIVTSRQNLATTSAVARRAAEHAQELARNATYQRIHELLIDPKAAAGRRRLFQAAEANQFPGLGEDGWDQINYSLALYDTLGGYMSHDAVEEAVVLESWHHPLTNIAGPVRSFMAHRERRGVQQPWAYLMSLISKAEQHVCHCPPR